MARQHVGRQDLQDLVAEHDPALAVDHADPVAVAVEADAELVAAGGDLVDQGFQIVRLGRVGVVVGEVAVDLREQAFVPAGQAGGQRLHGRAGGPVAGVPDHRERAVAVKVLDQPVEIGREHVDPGLPALPFGVGAGPGDLPDLLDLGAVERLGAQHHLEAVIVRRVVRAGDLQAAVGAQVMHGEVHHRRRPHADLQDLQPGRHEAGAGGGGELGRAQPAVIAQHDLPAAGGHDHGAEGLADGARVGGVQRGADDAANVVLAQERGVEGVRWHTGHSWGAAAIGRPMLV